MKIKAVCEWCAKCFTGIKGQVGRCGKTYCSMKCAGRARRTNRTLKEKRRLKAEYDTKYRARNADKLKAAKKEQFQRNYNPRRARIQRRKVKAKMRPYYMAYRRCKNWVSHKKSYDFELRASEYGPFADAWKVYLELVREIRLRCPSAYERRKAKGYYSGGRPNAQERKREAGMSRH